MAWSTIRKATAGDVAKLNEAAERFMKRHKIKPFDIAPTLNVEFEFDDQPHLKPLWRRIVRRVLGSPNAEGIAYGYVGFNVA